MFNYLDLHPFKRTTLRTILRELKIPYGMIDKKINNEDRTYKICDINKEHILKAIEAIKQLPDSEMQNTMAGIRPYCRIMVKRQRIQTLKSYLNN